MQHIGKQRVLRTHRTKKKQQKKKNKKQRLQRIFTANPLFVILQCNVNVHPDH